MSRFSRICVASSLCVGVVGAAAAVTAILFRRRRPPPEAQNIGRTAEAQNIGRTALDTWSFRMSSDRVYAYNPAIYWIGPTRIGVISRISGSAMRPALRCDSYARQSGIVNVDAVGGLDDFLGIFERGGDACSGIIQFDVDLFSFGRGDAIASVVNPFYSARNTSAGDILGFEDPRVFAFRRKPWILTYFRGVAFPFSTAIDTKKMGHHMCMFPLDMASDPVLLHYDGMRRTEKNWMPFEYDSELYVAYSVQPHKILHVDATTGRCTPKYETNAPTGRRGVGNGAPPQMVTFRGRRCFLGMAHTRDRGRCVVARTNFFYVFEASPPFRITHVSPNLEFTTNRACVEFGSGLLVDVDHDTLYVAYGVDDCCSSVSAFRLSAVLERLEPV